MVHHGSFTSPCSPWAGIYEVVVSTRVFVVEGLMKRAWLLIVIAGLWGCDGLFGSFERDLTTSNNATTNNVEPNGSTPNNMSTPNGETGLSNLWDSSACGDGEREPIECEGTICLAGRCGEVLQMDAGPNAYCTHHRTVSDTNQIVCWGGATNELISRFAEPGNTWAVIGGAANPTDVVHDVAVATTHACALLTDGPPPSTEIEVRCWGTNPLGAETTDFWGGVFDIPVLQDSNPKLSIRDSHFCLSGKFRNNEHEAVCWGRADESNFLPGTSTVDAFADVDSGELVPIAAPGLLETSRNVTCFSDFTGGAGSASGVRCVGNPMSVTLPNGDDFVAETGINVGSSLDVGNDVVCWVSDGRVSCAFGVPPGYAMTFDEAKGDVSDVRVATLTPEMCVRTVRGGLPAVECIFGGSAFAFLASADHYAMASGTMCATTNDPYPELVCYYAGPSDWPGRQIAPE